ncbi:hypothetical protein IMZ68_02010 [Candidatus Bathyarchaeota archaeon]|nr:hypothetical protein [Candidatus Bathyarchaeota archaeon]
MREWRAKQKAKTDEIDEQIRKQTEKVKQLSKKRDLSILDDRFSREPESTLEPQYPRQEEGYGVNAWGSSDSSEKPKPKNNQERLKTEFGNRAE